MGCGTSDGPSGRFEGLKAERLPICFYAQLAGQGTHSNPFDFPFLSPAAPHPNCLLLPSEHPSPILHLTAPVDGRCRQRQPPPGHPTYVHWQVAVHQKALHSFRSTFRWPEGRPLIREKMARRPPSVKEVAWPSPVCPLQYTILVSEVGHPKRFATKVCSGMPYRMIPLYGLTSSGRDKGEGNGGAPAWALRRRPEWAPSGRTA